MAAAHAGEPVISVAGLTKRYGAVAAVRDVSFQVARAEIFGLLGRNGAGKTTTVECLQGLRRADAGEVRVLGLDPRTQAAAVRRQVGCQLQESALPSRIKVWEALQWFASFSAAGGDWEKLIDQWGLAGKRDAHFAELSGGQRQRLFVALALVNDPQIVFLDEMTTGLDPAARHVAWELIEALRARGTTVVLVTHAMEEAERLCDRVAVMEAGRIVTVGTPSGLIAKHTREVTVRFDTDGRDVSWLAAIPTVAAVSEHGGQATVTGCGPVLVDVAAALAGHGLRPADLRVNQPSLEDVFLQITGHALDEG
ncbi:MAG TPA: ABC transporter ATP-binding protein [Streptosporangiaceae bacterium]